ncbi:MAG: tetratricopeptide repeat protein [Verrucomicrobiota bacterium]
MSAQQNIRPNAEGRLIPNDGGKERSRSLMRLIMGLMLLAALPWLLYGHTLHFETMLDDEPYVFNNPLLKNSESFLYPLYFKSFALSADKWGISPDVPLNFILRPVAYLSFYLNLNFGGHETAGFRLVNISLHMMNGMLLFLLARSLLGRNNGSSFIAALTVAVLFTAHPLATESVTYIVQRFESLSTLFSLLTLLAYIQSKKASSLPRGQAWKAGSLLCMLMAMFTKETAVTLPVLLVLLEMTWRRQTLWRSLVSTRWHLLLIPVIPVLIFASEWAQNGRFSVVGTLNITNGGPQEHTVAQYFMTQVCAWVSYLRLLILPVGQNFDHSYPLITSITDWRLISCGVLVLGLLLASWLFFRHRRGATGAMVLWGVLLYFITLAPSSSIVPLPDLFSEHRCYLPSIGIFIALAALLKEVFSLRLPSLSRFTLLATGSVCVLALSFATLLRNESYRTRESMWRDALSKGSDKARVWKGLGIAANNAGRPDDAIQCFKHATENHPEDIEAWINLCAMYVQRKRSEEALATANLAIVHAGQKATLLHLMAHAMVQLGRWQDAKRVWENILRTLPDHRDSHLSLAEIAAQTGKSQEAMRHLNAAERIMPLDSYYVKLKNQLQSQIASLP